MLRPKLKRLELIKKLDFIPILNKESRNIMIKLVLQEDYPDLLKRGKMYVVD